MNSKFYTIIRYAIVCTLGVLLHFTYNLSGQNPIVGLFSAVNESTWEHLKLLFFPMLFVTVFDYFHEKNNKTKLLSSRTLGILSGMLFITVVFYTIWGILGVLIDAVNIGIYFVGVFFSFAVEHKLNSKKFSLCCSSSLIVLLLFVFLFFLFTNNAPNLGLFWDISFHSAFRFD